MCSCCNNVLMIFGLPSNNARESAIEDQDVRDGLCKFIQLKCIIFVVLAHCSFGLCHMALTCDFVSHAGHSA